MTSASHQTGRTAARGARPLLTSLMGGVLMCSVNGCALIGPLLAARGSVDQLGRNVVDDAARSITGADAATLKNTSTDDIDRIMRENPDNPNNSNLSQLRNDLSQRPGALSSQPDDLTIEHAAQHDRHLVPPERSRKDTLVLEDLRVRTATTPRGFRPWLRIHPDFIGDPGATPPTAPALGSGAQVRFE